MQQMLQSVLLAEVSSVEWPSAIVAICLIGFLGTIAVVAIRKYDQVDDALKMCGLFSGVLGMIIGSFGTYFFSQKATELKVENTRLTATADAFEDAKQALFSVSTNLEPAKRQQLVTSFQHVVATQALARTVHRVNATRVRPVAPQPPK